MEFNNSYCVKNDIANTRQLFNDLQGGVTSEECAFLSMLASEVPDGCIVEIGSYRGKSAVAFAVGACQNSRNHFPQIFCIEPHKHFIGHYGGRFAPEDRGAYFQTMLDTNAFKNVALVNLSSDQAAIGWREPIGLLFIDGDHRYDAVKRDFLCWEPHLINGGMIVFDDATDPACGPKKLVDEILEDNRFIKKGGKGKIVVLEKIRDSFEISKGLPVSPQRILVACHELILSGGILRFEKVGALLREWGHEVVFCVFSGQQPISFKFGLPVLPIERAMSMNWDAVMVPGAGFPDATIEKFSVFQHGNFGTRIQHILNDQTRCQQFKKVNASFNPHVVIFNNLAWPVGSFTDFCGDRFHILQGAVDTAAFHPPVYRSHPLNSGRWIVGGLANKNPEPLISSLEYMPSTVGLRLFGPDIHALADKHQDLINAGRIEMAGVLTGHDLCQFYREVDCVVMTETNAGWANMVAESMASGTPVVCTPHGTKAFARHGETALIIGTPTPQVISDSVLNLKNDPLLCTHLTKAARQLISTYTWDDYARQLLVLMRHDGRQHYINEPDFGLFGKWAPEERLSGLKSLLESASGKSIIDFGSAEGVVAREFLQYGAIKVHSFEIDPQRVATAKALCRKWENGVFRVSDLSVWDQFYRRNKDILENTYDIVLYLGIHHHLPQEHRLTTLDQVADLAARYLAIRTPIATYQEDQITTRLLEKGFHEVDVDLERVRDEHLGVLKIFQKNSKRLSPVPINRHFVSFPKSGRTWVRFILNQLGADEQIHFHHDGFEYNNGERPLLDYNIEARIRKYSDVEKLVYLERDPRDTIVSLYYQVTGRFKDIFKYQGSISDFVRDEYFGAYNLKLFQNIWDQLIERFGFLKISYEECHDDMQAVIRKVLDYYDLRASSDSILNAVSKAEFKKMKRLEQSRQFSHPWLRPRNDAPKVRRGKVGGFREEFSDDDIGYLNQIFDIREFTANDCFPG